MITRCSIPDVLLFAPVRHGDERGYFAETFNQKMSEAGRLPAFMQDNESLSRQAGALRGLHLQLPPFAQAKLVRCVAGALLDVAVDVRPGSPTFGQHVSQELSAANGLVLYIPAGFAHGFCTRAPDTLTSCKVDRPDSAEHELGVAWDDPALGIEWGCAEPSVMSDKDRGNPVLADVTDQLGGFAWEPSAAG